MRNLSYENKLRLQVHFLENGFALKLALKQRQKGTRKWPIPNKYAKNYPPRPRCPKYAELIHFTLLFADDGEEIYQELA